MGNNINHQVMQLKTYANTEDQSALFKKPKNNKPRFNINIPSELIPEFGKFELGSHFNDYNIRLGATYSLYDASKSFRNKGLFLTLGGKHEQRFLPSGEENNQSAFGRLSWNKLTGTGIHVGIYGEGGWNFKDQTDLEVGLTAGFGLIQASVLYSTDPESPLNGQLGGKISYTF